MTIYLSNNPKHQVSYNTLTAAKTKRGTNSANNQIEQYFTKSHDLKIADNKLTVAIKYNTPKIKAHNADLQLRQIKDDITKTLQAFTTLHPLSLQTDKVLEVYIFNNKKDYKQYGTKSQYRFGNHDSGIYFYHDGIDGTTSKIFTYYEYNKPQNLKHEITHGLVGLITNGKVLPPILREGLAEYFQYLSDPQRIVQDFHITKIIQKIQTGALNLDLQTLLNTKDNTDHQDIIYGLGHALVEYFYKKDSGKFVQLLDSVKNANPSAINKMLQSGLESIYSPKEFQGYLEQNSIDSYMKEINALKVEKSTLAGIIYDANNNKTEFHQAVIKDSMGNTVASFSPVVHYYQFGVVRVEHTASGSRYSSEQHYLDISKEYTFLKLVSFKGQLKLIYCDKEGTPYFESAEFLQQIQKLQAHYQNHPAILAQIQDGLTYFDPESVVNISQKGQKGFMSYIKGLPSPENLIFKIKDNDINPAKKSHILTIIHNDQPVGELSYTSGFFQDKRFIYNDEAQQLYSSYTSQAYVALDKTPNGQVRASLLEGRQVDSDAYYQTPHIHRNEAMENIHIHLNNPNQNVDALLLKPDVKIHDHANSDLANSARQNTSNSTGFTISKGELLDDRGTSAKKDDVHKAHVMHNNQKVYSFDHMGYYVTENGAFFIDDYGKNNRYQLAKGTTHLKLVHKRQGSFLIPTDQYGREDPESVAKIPDEYRNIPTRFAYDSLEKTQDNSVEQGNSIPHYLVRFADFNKYQSGSLFTITADATTADSQYKQVILRDAQGKSVATLCDEYHYQKGKFFISADLPMYAQNKGFLMSTDSKIKPCHDKTNVVLTFDNGAGDVEGIDREYTAEKMIPISKDSGTLYSRVIAEEEYDVYLAG
ncbi:hypothetical protein [Candidatus Tisiphia endosymbiont of Nemotelus uliginosus]|uniref:hypothetical protein n=1 Tax=Candidatus Tisiphia endosymbiont of Nemotelus uliginosus TaxID=3077926 RepID=UPI0035C8DE95